MSNLILDMDIVVEACGNKCSDINIPTLLDRATQSGWQVWIYTAQLSEILVELVNQQDGRRESSGDVPDSISAQQRLLEFSRKYQWLSTLSDHAEGIPDPDFMANSLSKAASRLADSAMVVTRKVSRLSRGWPFVDIGSAIEKLQSKKIQYIDLASQQSLIRNRLEQNIHSVLNHGTYISGPEISELESRLADYVGVNHCIGMSSGTDALMVAMMACGIGRGDEVLTSPFTFFSTAGVIRFLGARPIYVDIDRDSYNLNSDLLEAAITNRTRAIVPVSLYGQCSDMDRINEIAKRHNLVVIEDAAQSFGATYKNRRSCGLSTVGCTSFFPSKSLGAYGDAGACFTDDKKMADMIRKLANHGQHQHYEHVRIGINGRMDSLQAAVLLAKLDILDDEIKKRNEISEKYRDLLKEVVSNRKVKLPEVNTYNYSAWSQYTVRVANRDVVRTKLASAGVPSAIHYPLPLYHQAALLDTTINCSNAELAAREVISLPVHPYLGTSDQSQIANALINSVKCSNGFVSE